MLKYILLLSLATNIFCQGYKNVIVSWDESPGPINGYFVYYYSDGITNRVMTNQKYVYLNGLSLDKNYNFFITSFEDQLWESDPSNLVSYNTSLHSDDIILKISNNQIKIKAIGGYKYTFESSEDLKNWKNLIIIDVPDNIDLSIPITTSQNKNFYRAKAVKL